MKNKKRRNKKLRPKYYRFDNIKFTQCKHKSHSQNNTLSHFTMNE